MKKEFTYDGNSGRMLTPVDPVIEMTWPADHVLPVFAPPAAIDRITTGALGEFEKYLFSILQGYVNKDRPRIMLYENLEWFNYFNLTLQREYTADDRWELVNRYKDYINGIVWYDDTQNRNIKNYAASIGISMDGYVPVNDACKTELENLGMVFDSSNTVDVRNHFTASSTSLEMMQKLYDDYFSQGKFTSRLLMLIDPGLNGNFDKHRMLDLAAAAGAAAVFLDERDPAQLDLMIQYYNYMVNIVNDGSTKVAMGWTFHERWMIYAATQYALGVIPGDFYCDSTLQGGMDHFIRIPTVPRRPALEDDKAYFSFFISDGDNVQGMSRDYRWKWNDAAAWRGQVALNYTIAPSLKDIGPGIMNAFYSEATDKECFVCGCSGISYMMAWHTYTTPHEGLWLQGEQSLDANPYLNGFTNLTAPYLAETGLRAITIWDGGPDWLLGTYVDKCRYLYGSTIQQWSGNATPETTSRVVAGNSAPLYFDKLVMPYTDSYDLLYTNLRNDLDNFDLSNGSLLRSYGVSKNSFPIEDTSGNRKHTIQYMVTLYEQLKADITDKKFDFVRADHYFSYWSEKLGLPYNICMVETTLVSASAGSTGIDNVVDGSNTTMWESTQAGNKWLQFDFGKEYDLTRYVIYNAEFAGRDPVENLKSWTVEVSLDGSAWTEANTVSDNTDAVKDVALANPHPCRYVRVTVIDPGTTNAARIVNVELYTIKREK